MIILIRHGEATHHTERLTGGWTDSLLTEKGREQIRALAKKLAVDFEGKDINYRIIASNLKRAAESADIIAAALGKTGEVEYTSYLREKNNGIAAGMTEDEAKKYFRKPASDAEIHHRNYPGGETRHEFYLRNTTGLWNACDVENENLIIVAHKGTVQNIIFRWLNMDMEKVVEQNLSVDIAPASVTVLGQNKWNEHCIFRLNDISHLNQDTGFGVFGFKYKKKS